MLLRGKNLVFNLIYAGLDGWTGMSRKDETRAEVFTGVRRKIYCSAQEKYFLRTQIKKQHIAF